MISAMAILTLEAETIKAMDQDRKSDGPRIMEANMEQFMPLIRECLEAGQSIRFSPKGISMMPMLRQDLDSVILSPIQGKLKRYDLPLYKRSSGAYILHRIIDVGETYTCMGDNQFKPEFGLRQDQMVALVTAFYRGDRMISVHSPGYRIYCSIWHHSRGIRFWGRKGLRWLRRHLMAR